jgi:hypothetical protein
MSRIFSFWCIGIFFLVWPVSAQAQYGRAPQPEFDALQRENDARFEQLGPSEQSEYRRRSLQMGNHLIIWGNTSATGHSTIDIDSSFGVFDGDGESIRMLEFVDRAVGPEDARQLRAHRRRMRMLNVTMMVVGAAVAVAAVPFMGSDEASEFYNAGAPDRNSPAYDAWEAEYDSLVERDDRRDLTGFVLLGTGLGVATLGASLEAVRHVRWSTPAARYSEDEVIGHVLRYNSLLLNELGAPPTATEVPAEPTSQLQTKPAHEYPVALIGRYGAVAIRE